METSDDAGVFRLRPDAFDRIDWPARTSVAWRRLAVSILLEGILRPLLGVTDADLDARTHVDYTSDHAEFLIAPTAADELQAVVRGGAVLPQKSTHFYPKLLDGLVFHLADA